MPDNLDDLLRTDIAPQAAFSYRRGAWLRWLAHDQAIEAVITELPDRIDRGTAAVQVEALVREGQVVPAFVVAMIWGHGESNYGPFRTARILTGSRQPTGLSTSDEVANRLRESVGHARSSGPVAGYRYLNNAGRCDGLGPAFFTKWLYFVTALGDEHSQAAAPVLDELVIRWLRRCAGIRLRYAQTSDYERYVNLLSQWGEPRGLAMVDVEQRIFRLIRNDGVEPPAGPAPPASFES